MYENDDLINSEFHSFPQNEPFEDRLKKDYAILDFEHTTSQIRVTLEKSKDAKAESGTTVSPEAVSADTSEVNSVGIPEVVPADSSEIASADLEPSTILHPGNLSERLGEKLYELLHREGSVPVGQISTILEQLDSQPIKTAPAFFDSGAAKERLSDAARQLQFEKDCLEAGIDPREAEFRNFGEITSPKARLIPFPKDEGLISAISFIAIAALFISAVVLDFLF